MTGEWPKNHIDHINGDRSDNRFSNLRDVPQSINRQNMVVASSKSSTGVLGVCVVKKENAFRVQIQSGGRRVSKRCRTLDEARQTYLSLKLDLHPGFNADRVVKA